MFTMMTILRKRPEVTTEEFRQFMEVDYGPTYKALPETRSYTQYYLADVQNDGSEDPIDAVVSITFDSPESMEIALRAPVVAEAAAMRSRIMREGTVGIHPAVVEKTVTLV